MLTFNERLNSVFSDIQFTKKEKEKNQLAFPDLVCRKDCGGILLVDNNDKFAKREAFSVDREKLSKS
ncbi:unnamed protein product [Dibothriocephalus latus]|uniref:Uncharacterized protein n=1 Tax=Dibothriocephalus latus TaxID=60516 RepID=A0A3P7NZP6_DIBLA|nr:unnamed protein product [Dibothriocephalus latus]